MARYRRNPQPTNEEYSAEETHAAIDAFNDLVREIGDTINRYDSDVATFSRSKNFTRDQGAKIMHYWNDKIDPIVHLLDTHVTYMKTRYLPLSMFKQYLNVIAQSYKKILKIEEEFNEFKRGQGVW